MPHLVGSLCEIACINSPTSTVVSGPSQEVSRLTERCRSQGHNCIKLKISYAFHSAQVDPMLNEFEIAARRVQFEAPSVTYISPLLARSVSESGVINASYLTQACRSTVNFQGAIEAAQELGVVGERTVWLEIGSHPACSGMIKSTLDSQTMALPSLRKDTDM